MEFDSTTEKIVFFGKWRYVVQAFFEFDSFTTSDFERIFQNVEFELAVISLDEQCEEFLETDAFLQWALKQLRMIISDLDHVKMYERGSEEYNLLHDKIIYDFIYLMYRNQKRSDESLELLDIKSLFDEELIEYEISMDGIMLEASDEGEFVQKWLYESFLLLSREEQITYYTEISDRINYVNLVNSCDRYNLSLLRVVSLIDGFRKSIDRWLEQLEAGTGNTKYKAGEFSKSIIFIFTDYHEYLKIAELSYTMKWVFKFLAEKRGQVENVYPY